MPRHAELQNPIPLTHAPEANFGTNGCRIVRPGPRIPDEWCITFRAGPLELPKLPEELPPLEIVTGLAAMDGYAGNCRPP